MGNLVTRRVQAIKGSLILTLPKRWVIETGLSKHDEVALSLDDRNRLVVEPVGAQP